MVKKAEKIRKRHPLTPIAGIILAVALFAVSYLAAGFVVVMPQVRRVIGNTSTSTATILFAIGIWFLLLGIAFFLVSVLVGKDPHDVNSIPLPPRDVKKRK